MTKQLVPRGGWARTPLPITPGMFVLDVGSGAFPNPRADALCDRDVFDNVHRAGLDLVVDRPIVVGDATELPFLDQSVDFIIASHIAEHVDDPESFCRELARVGRAGYIETPSPFADYVLDEEYHIWRVGLNDGRLCFRRKPPKSRGVQWLCDQVYIVFYSTQPSCGRRVRRIPDGILGRGLGFGLKAFAWALNRSGVMHTAFVWDSVHPLRWSVEQPDGTFINGEVRRC